MTFAERQYVSEIQGPFDSIRSHISFLNRCAPALPSFNRSPNLGGAPATNKAVQGQTAAQPEGAFLNVVNWVGNVIAPVGAALCVVMAIINYTHGRGVARWAIAAVGVLMVSGLTRLLEFWIQQGQAGVQ